MIFQTIGLAVLSVLLTADATDYCSTTICSAGVKHIACNNNGAFASTCPAGARLVDMTPHINLIVDSHNTKRNLIASGQLTGYNAASRMGTMRWNNELASIAALNVIQCAMKHDACRNTDDFKRSGQNLGSYGYSGAESGRTDAWLMANRIDAWWSEYQQCNQGYINSYPSGYTGPAIGHFTVMAADKNIAVGCAAARYFDGTFNRFLMACNYATTNIIGWPIYVSGGSTSGCTTGTNPSYTSLCSLSEAYSNLN